jgi:protoporphyrin/coproporphyrin ferrochelatase
MSAPGVRLPTAGPAAAPSAGSRHDTRATGPTGLVLLNLGGPADLAAIRPFLDALFADREIIRLPGGAVGQKLLSRIIVRARLPKVTSYYRAIGGGSPILRYTSGQGRGLAERMDARRPDLAPFKPYIAFRYAPPTSDDAVRAMHADGVRRAVVLTLYPQYSEATTGSSLRELHRALARTGLERAFDLVTVDRWSEVSSYLDALAARVETGLAAWPPERRAQVVVLMSAHSLPMSFVRDGDPYPAEIEATFHAVEARLRAPRPRCLLAYQSQTGPVKWLGPQTGDVVRQLGREGTQDVLVAPIAFVSDHIETLYEIDVMFAEEAREAGIRDFRRTESLNLEPRFLDALADVVLKAL